MIQPLVFWVLIAYGVPNGYPIPVKADAYNSLEACVKAGRKLERHIKKQVQDGWINQYYIDCHRTQI